MIKLIGKILEAYRKLVDKFLEMVAKIKALNPAYEQPGDGSHGVCDCIGLIIGAVRRMGLKWTGIHGSNYAARFQSVDFSYIEKLSDLELGDAVYKGVGKDGKGRKACNGGTFTHAWKLPDRYLKGKAYYTGDLNDYYHVGVVTQVNPLRITHMTSPRMKVDTDIGNWNYHGKVKPIVEAAEKDSGEKLPAAPIVPALPVPSEPVPSEGSFAIVVADNGKPVKMRKYPSTGCATWDEVKCGTKVEIVKPGEEWCEINCGRRKGWFMMARYLDVIGDGKGKY